VAEGQGKQLAVRLIPVMPYSSHFLQMPDLNARPVVITRPMQQAKLLERRVAAIGREAVVFPLLEILPLPDRRMLETVLQDLSPYAMVVFISPNAVAAAADTLKNWPSGLAIGVVGEGSKAALAQYGLTTANTRIVSPIDPLRTDSQTLLEVLDLDALRGRRVLIVRGEAGREMLADTLQAHGIQVEKVAAYRRVAPLLDEAKRLQLKQLLETAADWIITSSEALRNLISMVQESAGAKGVVEMQQQHLIVPHVRIAESAASLGFVNVTLTGSGDEQLLAALQSRP
jgi:uroporphyrinogen-III synthase